MVFVHDNLGASVPMKDISEPRSWLGIVKNTKGVRCHVFRCARTCGCKPVLQSGASKEPLGMRGAQALEEHSNNSSKVHGKQSGPKYLRNGLACTCMLGALQEQAPALAWNVIGYVFYVLAF